MCTIRDVEQEICALRRAIVMAKSRNGNAAVPRRRPALPLVRLSPHSNSDWQKPKLDSPNCVPVGYDLVLNAMAE